MRRQTERLSDLQTDRWTDRWRGGKTNIMKKGRQKEIWVQTHGQD